MENKTLQEIMDGYTDPVEEQESVRQSVRQPNRLGNYLLKIGLPLFLVGTLLTAGSHIWKEQNKTHKHTIPKKPAIVRQVNTPNNNSNPLHSELLKHLPKVPEFNLQFGKPKHELNPTGLNGAQKIPEQFHLPEICSIYPNQTEAKKFMLRYNLPPSSLLYKTIQTARPDQSIVISTKNPYDILTDADFKKALSEDNVEVRLIDFKLPQPKLPKFNLDYKIDNSLNLEGIAKKAEASVKPFDFDFNKFYSSESRTYDLLVKRVNKMHADAVAGITSWQVDYNAIKYLGKDNYVFTRTIEDLLSIQKYNLVSLLLTESTGIPQVNSIGATGLGQLTETGGHAEIVRKLSINPITGLPTDPRVAANYKKCIQFLVKVSAPKKAQKYSECLSRIPSFEEMKDSKLNIVFSGLYFEDLIEMRKGDVILALKSYNAGPGTVDNAMKTGAALPEETQQYVPKWDAFKDGLSSNL